MLHSVGNTHTDWIYRFLSIKLIQIENLFKYLNKKNIRTFFVKDLYDYDFKVPDGGVALTFDDGYLDNWIYLFPLLEKYNIKATIFVNPEFVDPREIVRHKLSEEIGSNDGDKSLGFLSWDEMKLMEKSGLVDIQSHSMSHTWFYTSSKLLDFYAPIEIQKKRKWDKQYPWISWNESPKQKPFTHNSYAYNSTNFGFPILEHGRSLGIKRFLPDENILMEIAEFAKTYTDIFSKDWFAILRERFDILTNGKEITGRYETDKEMEDRYWYELNESKKIIEQKLNKNITILCWPGGAYNEASVRISEEAGYLASTIASRERGLTNNLNKKYKRIPRRPMSANVGFKEKIFGPSFFDSVLIHKNFSDSPLNKSILKAEKLFRYILNK